MLFHCLPYNLYHVIKLYVHYREVLHVGEQLRYQREVLHVGEQLRYQS